MSTGNEEISTEGERADGAWYDARRERAVKKRGERSGGKKARGGAGSAEAITAGLLEIMEQSRLLRRGDRVAVAVSGGADSVALLLLLVELRQKLELTLHILHFNHKLRGRAAEADEKFVVKLAEEYRLPYWHGSAEVKSLAKRDKANVEDAARRARYAFFAQATGEHELDKIAVAHTADDQAETVLGHILRGSGLTGLGGIHTQVGKVVRPLLGARREELRAFLKSRKQSWREDATNRDVAKFRARIRKNLLPLLQKEFQPRVVEHLAALATHAREDDALLNRLAEERLKNKLEIVAEGARMRVADLLANDLFRDEDAFTALSSRLIRRIIRKHKSMHANAGAGELTAMHVGQVLELARHGSNGATLQLPGGIEVRRHADALVFCAATEKKATALGEEHQYEHEIDFLLGSTVLQVPELGCAFRFTVIDWLAKRAETSVSGAVLNRDALRFPLTLRSWRPGDKFRAVGHSKPQKLKRLFNEEGIDRWRRGGWPVIVSDGILAWARGFGASAEFAVDDETHTGIVIAEEKTV